jgi:hypothetical protein
VSAVLANKQADSFQSADPQIIVSLIGMGMKISLTAKGATF